MSLGPGTLQGLCVMCKAFLPQRPPNIAWHETALWLRHKSYLRFHKTSVTFGFTWEANSCLLDESSVRDPPVNPILHPSLLLWKLCCGVQMLWSSHSDPEVFVLEVFTCCVFHPDAKIYILHLYETCQSGIWRPGNETELIETLQCNMVNSVGENLLPV